MIKEYGWCIFLFGVFGGLLGWYGNVMLVLVFVIVMKLGYIDFLGFEFRGVIFVDVKMVIGEVCVVGLYLGLFCYFWLL